MHSSQSTAPHAGPGSPVSVTGVDGYSPGSGRLTTAPPASRHRTTGSPGPTGCPRTATYAPAATAVHPPPGVVDDLGARRAGGKKSTDETTLVRQPDPYRLVGTAGLQRLPPRFTDVVRELDGSVLATDDALAPGQLEENIGHMRIVRDLTNARSAAD
jgi:hypothetical protein